MAQKYTDPLYDALDADVTAKLGLPSGLLSKIRLNGERSNADQVSEKGARSVYQVIPETRAALIKKYNIDPYESPQAAAMGAGYLLKESLQRNNGDVASAVGEYIGGTDRANWGKTTRAYINRVMVALNQKSGGSGGSGGSGQRLTDVYEQSKPQGAVRPDTIEQKIFESRLAGHSDADIFKKIKEKDSRYKDSKKSGFTDQQIAEKLGLSIAATPVAPKPKDYTGNRMEQFTDQAGAAGNELWSAYSGDGGIIDGITSIPRAGIGGVQALMTGLGGMTTEAMAGLYGLGAGAVGAAQGKDFAESATQGIESARATLQPFVPQPVIAPNTANAILGAMAIPMYGTEAAGQANYDAYGNPLSAAAVQGLGDAGFAAFGFRGIGKAKPTVTPQPTPRPAEPTPQPITEPIGTPAPTSPAARAANSPDAIRDFVNQRQPLATNPADFAAQAEAMPRPDVAPQPAAQPILSGTGKPFSFESVAKVSLENRGLQATHEVRPFESGFAIFPKADVPRPQPSAEPPPTSNSRQPPSGGFFMHDATAAKFDDAVTIVGAGGLDLLHGSTKDGLTTADIQIFNPNATQNRKGRKNGGFYATADAAVAEKYANMPRRDGAPITPTVYAVRIKEGATVLEKSGDITRLTENFINEQRVKGVDVVFGKDPRGQSEYAIINPAAVVSVGKKPPAAPTAQPIRTPQGKAFTTDNTPVADALGESLRAEGFEQVPIKSDSMVKYTKVDDIGQHDRVYDKQDGSLIRDNTVTQYEGGVNEHGEPFTLKIIRDNQNGKVLEIQMITPDGFVTRLDGGMPISDAKIIQNLESVADVLPNPTPVRPTKIAKKFKLDDKPVAPEPQGKAFTTDNTPVDFVYDVVPIEAIQKSINADLTPNAAARPDLQPRNRDTDASTAQINEISNKLNPDRLLEAPTFDTGAPTIFGSEAVAGHGRLTAIERRYLSGRGADYKAAVIAKARELGIDPAKFERIENPVLVRRLSDDATAVKVASDSNADTTLKMSVAEQARTDAKSLPDASNLVITEKGEVNIAGSTDFVREFMRSMPTAARGDLMRPDGTLSQAGVRRIQAAIAQKAYNDATMIERINESLDDQGKRISAALVRNAGALVALADDVKAGARVENTLASDLAMAANKYSDIKASGSTVAEYMAQGRLVDDGMTPGALEALQVFGDNARSGKAVSEYIQGKIKEIEDQGNPSQETLFQSSASTKKIEGLIDQLADFEKKADEDPVFGFENYEVRQKILDDLVEAALNDDGFAGMAASSGLGQTIMITPSAKKAGAWQVTFFNSKMQPMSDSGIQTKQAALRGFFDRFVPEKKPEKTLFQTTKEQKEAEAVRRQYEGTDQWMKAPNGEPTKLSEQQWVQVRTPSFKEWFGDWENNPKGASKVVDENGEPLVVYHGSPFGEFNAFTESGLKNVSPKDAKGHYFTSDYGVAQAYGSGQYGGSMRGAQATVYASYLKINNPEYILDNNHRHWYIKQDKKDSLTSDGKDGVIYRDSKDTMNDEYIAFDPTQIKSATGNSGAFDSANPNIYMQGNKSASQVIADTIAKQVLDTGKYDADYAQAAGELAAAYYKATAAAMGKTSKEVFDAVGLDVTAGEVKSGANAQISFGDKRHSMVLGDKANASSFVHELGHHFLESHAKLADESPVIRADLDAIMEWGGHKGREYGDLKAAQKTELHEKFAETFEQYLLTGKAPTAKLKQVFERFKTWMESVYDSLISFGETNPRAKLSPDITNVLDNMLGNKADARANSAREAKKSEKADAELLDFKRSAPADGGVSPRQQQSRYNVLRAIGLTEGQIRGGVVTGDSRRMGWDSLLAKSDTEAGRKMKQQMELESDKLREYGDDIVKSTGGTVGAAPEVRGAVILKPLEAYKDWYKDQIKQLYEQADKKAKSTGGIELVDFQTKLRENSFFARDGMRALRKGIGSWLKEQELVRADGSMKPMSAKQAESLRQYINSQYDYSIASGIRTLNDLIDGAVFRVLGENMYADARKMNADYHRIFTEPKGMAALLEADGINRKTSVEKVGARLGALAETDVVQFEQIVKQLESMPTKALQADAKRAIGEIRAQIAEKLTAFDPTRPETPYSISKAYAPFRGGKLNKIFGKETADKLRNYVAASGVLRRIDPNPSGTASAMQNLKMRGAEVAATGVGTAAGGAMGGLTGATIGGVLGQQLGRKLQNRIIEAADQRAFDKAMSPKQFETMRQTMRARAGKLENSRPVQDAIRESQSPNGISERMGKILNARILRSAEWKAYFDNLSDADKVKIKQVGALAWLSSLGADQE